jgi:integrase
MDTFKINYYLQKVKHEHEYCFILISVAWEGNRVRTTLNIPIEPRLWNKDKQRVKASATNPRKTNDILERIIIRLNEYYDTVKKEKKRTPNKVEVKRAITAILHDKQIKEPIPKPKPRKTFMEYFDVFIKETETGDRLSADGKRISLSTTKSYITTKHHLEDFIKATKNEPTFEEIDDKFFAALTKYLANKKQLSHNSVGRFVKILKTFMHDTFQKGLHTNLKFIKALRVFDEETTIVALTEDELLKIENVSGLSPANEKCRDMFLVQVYTGLRYSDLANLKQENINVKEKIITINTIKTQDNLKIPLTRKLQAILAKYSDKLPIIANQKYNNHLKEICRAAEINSLVQLVHNVGKDRIEETKAKYELISSHTARRTFITLSLKRGVMPEMVQQVSGHRSKSRKSFNRYIKLSSDESARAVGSVWE